MLRVSFCDRPLSVVRRHAACVMRQLFYLNIFPSETAHWILTKLHRNDPCTKVVQTVPVGCISRLPKNQKIGFQNAIFKNLHVWNYKTQSFHIWYIALSRGPLPKSPNYAPGVKIDPARGSQFYIELHKEMFKQHLLNR